MKMGKVEKLAGNLHDKKQDVAINFKTSTKS